MPPPLRRRKVSAGWRISGTRPSAWDKLNAVCMWAIRKVIFTTCLRWRSSWGRTFWFAPGPTVWPMADRKPWRKRFDKLRAGGLYRISLRDQQGQVSEVVLEIRYRRLRIQSPQGKKKRYPALTV